MAKVTKTDASASKFPQGGKTKMFGKTGVGTQKPGQTSKESGDGGEWPKGGGGHMFGKQSASLMTPGQTGKP